MDKGLSYELFGFQQRSNEFNDRLRAHPRQDVLAAATLRVYLAGRIRYRMQIDDRQSRLSGRRYLLEQDVRALELYLLCTWPDVLSGDDFIDRAFAQRGREADTRGTGW